EGSGTYGHSCYEDAPQAAAVMSQAAGRPVRVQFMRWDELGWDNYGPAQLAEVRAAVDADGRIIAYTYDGWQHGWHINETSTELAMATPPAERAEGTLSIVVNRMSTGSMYRIANRRVVSHAIPMLGLLKGSPLRSPLDMALSFASEQTIDELAHAAKLDPLEFRRKNMGDTRWPRGRRDRGQQAPRRHGPQAFLRRARLRPRRHPSAGREPDRRHDGAGDEP